jgi:hypothetical protein
MSTRKSGRHQLIRSTLGWLCLLGAVLGLYGWTWSLLI